MHTIRFMSKGRLAIMLSLALILSAFVVSPALADGETPPPPPEGGKEVTSTDGGAETAPADEVAPAEEQAPAEESAPAEEGAPAEESAPVEESAPAEAPAEEVAPAADVTSDTAAEALAALPEGTDLVVLNADGETVSLASDEASEIIAGGDPIWCPAGVASPVAGPTTWAGGCSPSFPDFYGATLYFWLITEQPNVAGTIWFAGSYDAAAVSDGTVILDGLDYTSLDNFALTIKGGWTGVGGTIDTSNPSSFNDGGLQVINWTGNVTISNIIATGAFNDASGHDVLWVDTTGKITLDRVQAVDSTNIGAGSASGAEIDNRNGSGTGAGTITVTNSSFGNNDGNGVHFYSDNTITLKNVMVYDNGVVSGYTGAFIDNDSATTAKAITITNSVFSGNGYSGASIDSNGTVTLSYVTASNNLGNDGVEIDTDGSTTLSGNNTFNNNDSDGLDVDVLGTITVANTTANDNGAYGILLDNSGAATPKNIVLSGLAIAGGNTSDGISIYTKGSLTAANLTAHNNMGNGLYVNNTYGTGTYPVTITGTNLFHDNASDGVNIVASGAVSIANVTSIFNATGVFIDNTSENSGGVTISGFGVFHDNQGGAGLQIYSDGAVTLSNITSVSNFAQGVYVDNTYNATALSITLNGYNVFEDNLNVGLELYSRGNVTLNNLTAADNTGDGVYVDNTYNGTAQALSIKGVNLAHDNSGSGFTLYSRGVISLNSITSIYNSGDGVYLDNTYNGNPQSVKITGTNLFQDNTEAGIEAYSRGTVTMSNVSSVSNSDQGVYLDNSYNLTPLSVSFTGYLQVRDNSDEGLLLYSRGAITLTNVTAINNGNSTDVEGVYIYNQYSTSSQMGVTLKGTNIINDNAYHGLRILSYGAVALNNITALSNGNSVNDGNGQGVYVTNTGGTLVKGVTVTGINVFNYNDGNGLYVVTDGAISVSKPTAYYNGYNGLHLDNTGPFQANVTISGFGQFSYNGVEGGGGSNEQDGLELTTHGTVTLANITATHNFGGGAYIETLGLTSAHNVTLSGTNTFNYNGNAGVESGLVVVGDGSISLSNLSASYNFYRGADLTNTASIVSAAVSVNGFGNFYGNVSDYGLQISSDGNVTLNRVAAYFNGNRGIFVTIADGTGSVTLVCSSASANLSGADLRIDGATIITLKGFLNYDDFALYSVTPTITTCP